MNFLITNPFELTDLAQIGFKPNLTSDLLHVIENSQHLCSKTPDIADEFQLHPCPEASLVVATDGDVDELYTLSQHEKRVATDALLAIVMAKRLKMVLITNSPLINHAAQNNQVTTADYCYLLNRMVEKRVLAQNEALHTLLTYLAFWRNIPVESTRELLSRIRFYPGKPNLFAHPGKEAFFPALNAEPAIGSMVGTTLTKRMNHAG